MDPKTRRSSSRQDECRHHGANLMCEQLSTPRAVVTFTPVRKCGYIIRLKSELVSSLSFSHGKPIWMEMVTWKQIPSGAAHQGRVPLAQRTGVSGPAGLSAKQTTFQPMPNQRCPSIPSVIIVIPVVIAWGLSRRCGRMVNSSCSFARPPCEKKIIQGVWRSSPSQHLRNAHRRPKRDWL